jgi:hypothetical protein
MDSATLMTLVVAAVVIVAAVVMVAVVLVGRRRLEHELRESRAELDAVRERVEQLSTQVEETGSDRVRPNPREFVITSLRDGDAALTARDDEAAAPQQLSAGQFASVALGESLVRVLSLGYGVGRALSPENRNRIRFAMRQEIRRSRRQRRREIKQTRRDLRTQQAGGEDVHLARETRGDVDRDSNRDSNRDSDRDANAA